MTGGSDKGRTESLEGASPTFHGCRTFRERLRLRLRWTPRPVPESSKPSLILLYAGKDDAGALDAYLHAYNPAFLEYIFGRWTSGERVETLDRTCWARSLSLRCAPWSWRASALVGAPTAGRGASSDGSPNRVPPPVRGRAEQTLWNLEDLEPRVMEDTDNDSVLMLRQMYLTSLAYKGLGQLTVPQVGSSFLEHPMDPMECSKARAQQGAHRSGSRGPTFNGRAHSTTPSSSLTSAAWARWL